MNSVISLDDVFFHVMTFLDYRLLYRCMFVSRDWKKLAETDVLWVELCSVLWSDKVHVSPQFRRLQEQVS